MVAGLAAADPLAAHLVIVRHLHDGSLRARAVVKHFALQCNLGGNLVIVESTIACLFCGIDDRVEGAALPQECRALRTLFLFRSTTQATECSLAEFISTRPPPNSSFRRDPLRPLVSAPETAPAASTAAAVTAVATAAFVVVLRCVSRAGTRNDTSPPSKQAGCALLLMANGHVEECDSI